MSEHPAKEELAAFLEGELPNDRMLAVARHLLTGCLECRQSVAPLYKSLESLADGKPAARAEGSYELAIDSAIRKVRSRSRYLRREDGRAGKIAAVLEGGGGLRALVDEATVPLRELGTVKALLKRSWAVRHDDPREMVSLARAAVEAARKLDARRFGPRVLADLQAWTWGEYGNALRAADDLDEAERAFGTAFDHLTEGTGDLQVKARLYDLHASFLGTRRRFELAFAAFDVVHSIYLELGDRHLAGKALLMKAIYTHYSGRTEEALEINQRGMALVDVDQDPVLVFSAVHNRLVFLVACGRFWEAKKALFVHRKDLRNISGRVNLLKIRWLQGQISAGLGEWKSAEAALAEVKDGFQEAGKGFAAALASLELALVWLHQNRHAEAEDLALETVEVFVALRIRREAFGALMILQDALRKKTATVGLLEDAVDFLRRSEVDPDARFVPSGR